MYYKILVDYMADNCGTIIQPSPDNEKEHFYEYCELQAAQKLVEDGATKIYAILTHGIFRYFLCQLS